MSALSGARVLVTGGAGTIGSTIVDQVLDAGAAHVVVLDNLVRGRRENLADAMAGGKVELVVGDIARQKADMVVVHLFEGEKKPAGAAGAVDASIGGAIEAAIGDGDFKGESGETLLIRPVKGIASPRLLVVGLGRKEKFTGDHVRQSMLPVLRAAPAALCL